MTDPYKGQENVPGLIYLLHLEQPIYHAQHYIGWCGNGKLDDRLAKHRKSNGARLLRAANLQGIEYRLVRLWAGTRHDERRIKRWADGPRLCPCCVWHPRPVHILRPVMI